MPSLASDGVAHRSVTADAKFPENSSGSIGPTVVHALPSVKSCPIVCLHVGAYTYGGGPHDHLVRPEIILIIPEGAGWCDDIHQETYGPPQ